jgi:hypothetical protein
VRVHALYTPSHSRLVEEHFRPSAERYFGAASVTCELVPDAPEGDFGTPEFTRYCQGRLRRYVELCEGGDGPLVLSDVDVRFYGDVPTDLAEHAGRRDHDAYFQWDGKGGHCMGLVLVWRRAPFAQLLRQVAEVVRADVEIDDQQALKRVVRAGRCRASLGILPTWKYWTAGLGGHIWLPGDPLSPPVETMLTHHGNWTWGVPNKLELLAAVAKIAGARGAESPGSP